MGSLDHHQQGRASRDDLTLIITTSPTPSAPSTELLDAILDSFATHCPDLLRCRVIVVLDTYDRVGAEARLKKGQVTAQGARDLDEYKANVKELILRRYWSRGGDGDAGGGSWDEPVLTRSTQHDAEFGYDANEANHISVLATTHTHTSTTAAGEAGEGRPVVTFLEPAKRLGFGLAVRTALRLTTTSYVWVQQHDWALVADVPLGGILEVMRGHDHDNGDGDDDDDDEHEGAAPPVKYVCLPSVRMLRYATSGHVVNFPALKKLTAELRRDFVVPAATGSRLSSSTLPPPSPSQSSSSWIAETGTAEDGSQQQKQQRQQHPATPATIPLTPMFFWHDKPHVASTAHYLSRVFPTRLAIPRGAFIEDTIGQRGRNQMKEGQWARWACWMYYPDDGQKLCLRHLQGRTWKGAEGDLEHVAQHRERNALRDALEEGRGEGGE